MKRSDMQRGRITVRRGEEAWTIEITDSRENGREVSEKFVEWMESFSGDWPEEEQETMFEMVTHALENSPNLPHGGFGHVEVRLPA